MHTKHDFTATVVADRYTLERELGRGGMATVWAARDLRHDRLVAVKILHPELAGSIGVDRFIREVRLTARLQHPNIVPILDSGLLVAPDGTSLPWYAMTYLEGESLRTRLARQPRRVVVSLGMARLVWPGQNSVGRRLTVGSHVFEVVGLVANTRFRDMLTSAPIIYTALAQADSSEPVLPGYMAVRSDLPPARVAALVGNVAKELAADAIVYQTTSMGEAMQG